jgi:dipeptidyl-peptidase-3
MEEDKFNFLTEQFDDIKILRYQVPAFGQLPLREKIFVYYLSQAALAGRDILWDQNNRYNLRIRKILERIVREYPGDRNTDEFERFLIYTKKVFFAAVWILTAATGFIYNLSWKKGALFVWRLLLGEPMRFLFAHC